jgi:hypothetical protein
MKLHTRTAKSVVGLFTCLVGICLAPGEVLQNSIDPFETAVFIDCDEDGIAEDILYLTGDLHTLVTQTVNKRGGVTFTTHFQPVNVSAVGLLTGDTYRAVGLTRSSEVFREDHAVFTLVNNFYMIGQKSGIKSLIHETLHGTVVGGEVKVLQDHFEARCR